MAMTDRRKAGYYWVRRNQWEPAYFDGYYWSFTDDNRTEHEYECEMEIGPPVTLPSDLKDEPRDD